MHFKISDIYIPDPLIVLYQLHGNDLLCGQVIEMSDSGIQKDAFAVIAVEGIEQALIVPVDCVAGVDK